MYRLGLFALAALALSPHVVPAQQLTGKLLERAIPSSGEKLPVVGLAFSNHPSCADHGALKEVVKTFAANGGRYYDATLGNAANQRFHADAANELGVTSKLFISTPGFTPAPPPGLGAPGVKMQIDSALARSKTSRIDVAWVNAVGDPALLAALKEEKKAGRIRYIGVLTIVVANQAAQLENIMRTEPIDLIGVDFDIGNRFVEEKILPLAIEKKIGVISLFPLGNNFGLSCSSGGNLFARVGSAQVPAWAAEFDAKTWAQFFIKYVISHPAVTVARVGTSKVNHMIDDMAGGVGRLPNEATRKRMAALIDSFPKPVPPQRGAPQGGAPQAGSPPPMPPGITLPENVVQRYVGEYKTAGGFTATFRREGATLFVKPGNNPEVAMLARSETRFQDPRGPTFEFQLDAQGKVTGAILEENGPQGPRKTPLTRTP